MTVKDIALIAAAIMQADDLEYAIENFDVDNADNNRDADLKTLIACVNLAVAEAASDAPIVNTAVIATNNGIIPYEALDGELSTVRGVKKNGKHVRFSVDSRGICVGNNGEYEILYTVALPDKDLADEVSASIGIDKTVLGYSSARNYCLVTGRTDEASIWDQRYNAEMEKLKVLRRAYIPKRAWR